MWSLFFAYDDDADAATAICGVLASGRIKEKLSARSGLLSSNREEGGGENTIGLVVFCLQVQG